MANKQKLLDAFISFNASNGKILRPSSSRTYVRMMRMIPDEGIKPIEIKKAMIPASADIGAVRGWGTDTFRAMRNNGLTRMEGRRIFLTDDGKRLLDAVEYGPRMSGNADADFISDVARSRLHDSDAVLDEYRETDRDVVPWILENWNK